MMWNRLFPALLALLIGVLAWQAPASARAEADLLKAIRAFAEITSGELVGDGKAADKLVFFARTGQGQLRTIGIQALAPGGDWVEPMKGAIAIMRTRASTSNGNSAPEPADLDYVRRSGIPVFIVGEWSAPPPIWQIVREGRRVRWREIDGQGRPGPWRAAPTAASN
jgi:hypothetical protein